MYSFCLVLQISKPSSDAWTHLEGLLFAEIVDFEKSWHLKDYK